MRANKLLFLTLFAMILTVAAIGTIANAASVTPFDTDTQTQLLPPNSDKARDAASATALDLGDPVDFDAALQAGADYLRVMQADITDDNAGNGTDGVDETPDDPDDGGWDWKLTSPPDPFHHSTAGSPTNIYGATAIGLYYAYLESGDAALFTAMQDAADFAVAAGPNTIRSGADLKFLMLFNDLYSSVVGATTVYSDAARAKYDGRVALYGSMQAYAELIRDTRNNQGYGNGIIGWDVGIWAVDAQMLYDRYGAPYDADADAVAEVLWQDSYNSNPGYFDIVADAGWDPTYTDKNFWWYTLGLTGLIDAFSTTGSHTAEIPDLIQRLLDSQFGHGGISFSYGANADDEDWQSTAYAGMCLGTYDQATYQDALNRIGYFLGATQDVSGGWLYSNGDHVPEEGGECTAALYFTNNLVTDVLVDDDFVDQASVDVYNDANGTNYVWGYTAFATITAGMNAVNGSTVYVNAGTYNEALNITLDNLSIIGEDRATVIIDATGQAFNNAGIYVNANNVTLQGFTLKSTAGNSLPRYGVKFADINGGLLDDVEIYNIYRTGVDMLGTSGVTVNNVNSHDNGGNGMQCGDAHNITFSNITTANNAWGGLGIFTWGQYTPLGTDGIVISGTNSFGEFTGGVSPLYLEQGNYANPAAPEPITYSTNPGDGADVTFQIADFTHTFHGNSDNDNVYVRFYPSLTDAQNAAAGPVSHILDDRYIVEINGTNLYVPANLGGVQAAVSAASDGDMVHVDAGPFEEQVVIEHDIVLQGAGAGSTTIQSPITLTEFFATTQNNYPIVLIRNTDNAEVRDLTVDGLGRGNTNYRFVGVGFAGGGGGLYNCDILNIEDTPFSGSQHGIAIYTWQDDGVTRAVTVDGCNLAGFQKGAMALNAGATTGMTVNVTGNTVTGYGPTDITAQNGIQAWGDLITGTIADNVITGIAYDNTNSATKWVASSILNYYAGIDITGNTVTNGHVGIYNYDGYGTIADNDLTIEKIGVFAWGIIASDPPRAVPSLLDADLLSRDRQAKEAAALLNVDVTGNTVIFSGPDNTSTFGIETDAGYGPDNLAFSANDNTVSGFEVGLEIYACQSSCDVGVFTDVSAHGNRLGGNTIGARSNVSYLTVDAENNYWGSFDGPEDLTGTSEASVGTCYAVADMVNAVAELTGTLGAPATDGIDYCPWISSALEFSTNSIVTHCPDIITFDVSVTAGLTAMEGANIAIQFPAELSFAGASVSDLNFQLLPISQSADGIGYDTVFVPFIVKTGYLDGPATMYTVTMTANDDICAADQISMVSADLRDTANAAIVTPLPTPIDVTVDCSDPVFATTTADGGYYNVPPALDISASDNCDLDALYYQIDACDAGGWVAIETGMTGTAYSSTWTLPTADFDGLTEASHCLRFKVVDDAARGNADSCTFTWCFTKDVTAPPPPTGLTAAPGHNKVKLAWTNAATDFDHTIVMRTDWNASGHGYPEYGSINGSPEGPYPTATTGDLIVSTTATAHEDTDDISNATRDIYHYAAFTVDAAGNVSVSGPTARSTSYWLGDVAGSGGFGDFDGYVYAEDLNPLTIVYGKADGDVDWYSDLDYGPTDPGGAKDIPVPDDSVNFEDGILFAINFDAVTPLMKARPMFENTTVAGPLAIALTERDGSYRLALNNNPGTVKGIHVVLTLGANTSLSGFAVTDPVQRSDDPVFSKALTNGNHVTVDMILLGSGRAILGSGDLADLTFTTTDGSVPEVAIQQLSLRDVNNTELAAEAVSGPTGSLPQRWELSQNYPNPFNPTTSISFSLAENAQVRLTVYNLLGQNVATLVDGRLEAGSHTVEWDATDNAGHRVSSGVYFYRLESANYTSTRKMLLLK